MLMASRITCITGCMFAGKTHRFQEELSVAQVRGEMVGVIKPIVDGLRSESRVNPERGQHYPLHFIKTSGGIIHYAKELKKMAEYTTIGVDEFQFFNNNFCLSIIGWCKSKNIDLIISGLTRDYTGQSFGSMPKILWRADEIIQCFAVCNMCRSKNATRTHRITTEKDLIVIGSDSYEARCVECSE